MIKTIQRLYQRKQLWFLLSLLGILFVAPLEGVIVNLLLSVSLLTAVYGISDDRTKTRLMSVFGILAFVLLWLNVVKNSEILTLLVTVLLALFFIIIAVILLEHTLRAKVVDGDVLIGAIALYMVLGIIWAYIYALLVMNDPSAFSYSSDGLTGTNAFTNFTYYSFVTLTTLGYGDITPVGSYARIFSYLEAITGVMYIAVLVSRFVGRYGHSRTE